MRHAILPLPGLILLAIVAGIAIAIEWASSSDISSARVVASSAHCTGRTLEVRGNVLTLTLACDAGNRRARTVDAIAIKRYTEAPSSRFVCAIHRSGLADCAERLR